MEPTLQPDSVVALNDSGWVKIFPTDRAAIVTTVPLLYWKGNVARDENTCGIMGSGEWPES